MRLLSAISLLYTVASILAFPSFLQQIPNGDRVHNPCNQDEPWPGIGHFNPEGGLGRNQFGLDFVRYGRTWSAEFCYLDSDGDGRTNGEELGDPDCLWIRGQNTELSPTTVTHPGICEPVHSPVCKEKNEWLQCSSAERSFKCDALNELRTRNFSIKFPKLNVPAKKTTYICLIVETPADDDYHIVANQPIIDNELVMHHMLLYGCNENEHKVKRKINKPYECGMEPDHLCTDLLGIWSIGMTGECMHKNAGFRIGKTGYRKLALQMHWSNFDLRSDLFDASGMILHFTPELRPYDAGTLWVGQTYIEIPPKKSEFPVYGTCTSECSRVMFQDDIHVIGALNHMHYLGKRQHVTLHRGDKYVLTLTNDTVYSYDNPVQVTYNNPIVLKKGDELKTVCVFDSSKRQKTTMFGDGTDDEMCFTFLKYYPRENIQYPKCVSHKGLSLCKAVEIYQESFPDGLMGCNIAEFSQLTNPKTLSILFQIQTKCIPYICIEECMTALRKIRKHPCLQNEVWEYIKSNVAHGEAGLLGQEAEKIMAAYTSCDFELGKEAAHTENMAVSTQETTNSLSTGKEQHPDARLDRNNGKFTLQENLSFSCPVCKSDDCVRNVGVQRKLPVEMGLSIVLLFILIV